MKLVVLTLLLLGLTACMSEKKLGEALKKNPKLLTDAIEANPAEFIEALQKAAGAAKEVEEKRRREDMYKTPLEPAMRSNEVIRGSKDGKLVLVEYSDFQCPFCSRAFDTVSTLLEKYKGNIQFIHKHLPLSFHPQAMITAQYFEALALQDEEKAWQFHDEVYKNQQKLKNGESFLKKLAKDTGAKMDKLAKDINSEAVKKKIQEDLDEAAKFGFQGTPGFVWNGVPIKGAYPLSHFEEVLEELKKRGRVKM